MGIQQIIFDDISLRLLPTSAVSYDGQRKNKRAKWSKINREIDR